MPFQHTSKVLLKNCDIDNRIAGHRLPEIDVIGLDDLSPLGLGCCCNPAHWRNRGVQTETLFDGGRSRWSALRKRRASGDRLKGAKCAEGLAPKHAAQRIRMILLVVGAINQYADQEDAKPNDCSAKHRNHAIQI